MKERIEYIDAMRGLVMLLVVMWHAKLYSINLYGTFSLNDVFFLIMMPAFFFISGLVGSGRWKCAKYLAVLPPTLFFMILWGYQAGWSLHAVVKRERIGLGLIEGLLCGRTVEIALHILTPGIGKVEHGGSCI